MFRQTRAGICTKRAETTLPAPYLLKTRTERTMRDIAGRVCKNVKVNS